MENVSREFEIVKAKTEAIVNTIGFGLLLLLMIVVTIGDIIKLF